MLSRLELELVRVLGFPKLLVALYHFDEPRLRARRVGLNYYISSVSNQETTMLARMSDLQLQYSLLS
jgi:hypothetical protein